MTDNDIIKALECCTSGVGCKGCPYMETDERCYTDMALFRKSLDLINRQQAEIERLTKCRKEEVEKLMSAIDEVITEAKAESIKEFAERLKEKKQSVKARFSFGGEYISNGVMCADIDNLVAEMVGDSNAE